MAFNRPPHHHRRVWHAHPGMVQIQFHDRWACAIPDPDSSSVVITGGLLFPEVVSRYGRKGWIEDLQNLTEPRSHHGCGSYTSNGQRVCFSIWLYTRVRLCHEYSSLLEGANLTKHYNLIMGKKPQCNRSI